jgi:hypothetical protein
MSTTARRAAVLLVVTAAMALATALPAAAKGPPIGIRVTVTVTGPGQAAAVVLHWGGRCSFPEFCGSSGNRNQLDGYAFLNGTGVMGRAIEGPAPPLEQLGPKYVITYRAVSRGVVMTAHQDLYPFGPGTSEYDPQRPWLYAPPGQHLFSGHVPGGWLLAPTSLVSILRDHGFSVPAPPPTAWAAAPAAATEEPSPGPGGPAPWALALGALALAAMVAVGAALGRARSARRSPDPTVTS